MTGRILVLAAAAALAALPARAQDIETLSAETGVPLPAGYYERIRRDPGFFETRHEWRRKATPVSVEGGAPGNPAAVTVVRGDLRMVVMNTLFADSREPTMSAGTIHEQLFGDNPLGNLTDFYRQQSGGVLNIQGTALPWVRTRFTRREATGDSYGLGSDANLHWHLREALEKLDATVNFAQYDNDGPDNIPNSYDDDGKVDLAVFQFSEVAGACGEPNSVWPHRSGLSAWLGGPFITNDLRETGGQVLIDDYHIQSAVNCDGTPQSIATIAHETGHAFGLPDFYDASEGLLPPQRRWVLGCWTLMAAGAWGCGDGATFGKSVSPSQMGPYEKLMLGWLNPVFTQPGWRREYILRPIQTSGDALMVPLLNDYEYLLVEYRPNTGFDRHLPAGGVLVYHVEISRPLYIFCFGPCRRVYRASLVEADGDTALIKRADQGGNRGVAGDIFTGTRALDDFTTPSIRLNSQMRSGVALDISVEEGRARVFVSTFPQVASTALIAPLLGTPGAPPNALERAALDRFGNRNGGYDLGDLRAYMRGRPGTVRQGT